MRYCRLCVLPDSKPFVEFDKDGVCNACQSHRKKHELKNGINWDARQREFQGHCAKALAAKNPNYDVMVPVSGGKDSISQVHRVLQANLRVLAVHVDYGIKTEIGQTNLNLIPKMGASLLIIRPEQIIHNRLIRIGFEDYGDPDLMSHALLYAYPLWVAARFAIPLCFEGENSAFEYGGDKGSGQKSRMDREWFYKYVVTKGVTVQDIARRYEIPLERLRTYEFPEEELANNKTNVIFCSHYFNWDSEVNLAIAQKHGFQSLPSAREGTFRNYVGIDEKINRIHQFMKVLKFGYGRATDHACEEVRNGRISRDRAIELVREYDIQPLSEDYVDDFCHLLGYTNTQFWSIMERYRNPTIVQFNKDRSLSIVGHANFAVVGP